MPQIIVIPFDGQEIGQGYNSESRESIGTGLTVADTSEDPAANGQTVTTLFESVSSQESLAKSLGISASLDVRYGLFSGGAKFDFAENHAVNSFSSFIAGRCVVHNAIRHGHGFKLNDDAGALVKAQRMDEFKTAFGDMFVRSLKTGGEFDVVVRITSVSEKSQTQVAASLNAAYNGICASGDFKASFDNAMTETKQQTEITVFMFQAGGSGKQAAFTGPDATKVLDRLSEFPSFVHEHPVGYEVELASYNTIPIPVPTAEEREDRDLVLRDCLAQKTGFLKALSDLDLLLNPNASLFFDDLPPQSELVKIQGQYRSSLNGLMAHAIKIATGKMDPPQTFVANPAPPPLVFKKKAYAIPPVAIRAAAMSFPNNLPKEFRSTPKDFRLQAKMVTEFTEQTTPGFMGLGLGITSEKSGRSLLFFKGVGSGGRVLLGTATTLQNDPSNKMVGERLTYLDDTVHLRMTKKANHVTDMSFSRNGQEWIVLADNVDLTSIGFAADDTYKVLLTGYSTCDLPVSGDVFDVSIVGV